MKVTLRGGPETQDGQEIEIEGGSHILIQVAYKTPSFIGHAVCDKYGCPDRGKHTYDKYKSVFNRKYEIMYRIDDDGKKIIEAHYRGEE